MPETITSISFAKLEPKKDMPHLLDIQTRAFEALLQTDAAVKEREDIGLERVFKDLFPISDVHENFSLEFVRYSLGEPKYSVEECIERDMTYSAPLKATLQLVINEDVNGVKRPRNIIEKKKKFPATALLRAFGYGSNSDILRLFFAVRELDLTKKRESRTDLREVLGAIIAEDITLAGEAHDPDAPKLKTKKARAERERAEAEMLVKEGDELTPEVYNRLRRLNIDAVKVFASYMLIDLRDEVDAIERGERPQRRVLAVDVVDPDTGEVVAETGQQLTDTLIRKLRRA